MYYLAVPAGSRSTGPAPSEGSTGKSEKIHVRRKRKSSDAQINFSTNASYSVHKIVSTFITMKAADIYHERLEQCVAAFVS